MTLLALWGSAALAAGRHPSLEGGVGLGLLGGGSGNGYGVGASQRVGVDIPAGPVHGVFVAAEHAHHRLRDASAYFPDELVPEDAMAGFRDRWALTLGGRFQLQLADPAADRLVVEPLAEVGVGVIGSHTVVEAPGFAGRTTLGAWNTAPALALGLGADVRLRRFLALVPALRVSIALQQDPSESGGDPVYGTEVRGDLGLAARVTW